MDDDRLQKVEELFHAALVLELDQRDEFLFQASASDPEIIAQVQSLLLAYEEAGNFLDVKPALTHSAADFHTESLAGQEIGHFRILSLLGRGGMGEVYLAEDTKLRRKVAIKSLPLGYINKRANKRLLREARAAAGLDHQNICSIYEIREERDRVFIIMQYVEGETLASRIENKRLSLSQSLDIAIQIAEALAEAHSHGIIHRDIKPQNIIIGHQGQTKVLDFGLAKVIESDRRTDTEGRADSLITEETAIVGTPMYMSPEQARGDRLDSRSDLFSLGVLLFECVTGRKPFCGNSLAEIFANIIHVNPQPASSFNPTIPPGLDAMLSKALAKDSNKRFQSTREMLAEMRSMRETLQSDVQTELIGSAGRARLLRKMASRTHLKTIATTAAVSLVIVTGLTLYLRPFSDNQLSIEARKWYERGASEISSATYYQATRALTRAIELDNDFALSHARLAEAWSELDYTEKAKDEMLIATSLIENRQSLPPADSLYLDGLMATLRRDFAGAVETYKKLAEQAASSEKQHAYLDLGRAHERNEDSEKALESYLQSVKYDAQYAPAHLRLGSLYGRRQDLDNARRSFEKAESLYQDMSNQEGVSEVLYSRGALLNGLDKTAEARAQLERALKIAEILQSRHQQIKTMLELSSVSYTEGNGTQAQEYATQAIELARNHNLENLTASGLIELGNTYFIRGEYQEAKKHFRQAIEFAGQSKGRHSEARALLSLGSLFIQQNNSDEGLPLVEQSMKFYQQGGYRKEAMQAVSLLGRCYGQRGHYEAALEAYRQQLDLARQAGDQSQIAFAHISLGSVLGFFQERYPEALIHFDESYKINSSLVARLNTGYDLASRGSVLWPVGRYREAESALGQAYSLAQNPDNNDKYLTAWVYLFKARIALSKGQLNMAREKSRQALDLSTAQFKDIAIQAKYTLGLAEALGGQTSRGRLLCQEAVGEAASLSNPRYISEAVLFLSEVLLAGGDSRKALEKAIEAQASFARFGQQASEWQALTIASRAASREGDQQAARQYASRALGLLTALEQRWGAEAYNGFSMRLDVQKQRRQVEHLLATEQ